MSLSTKCLHPTSFCFAMTANKKLANTLSANNSNYGYGGWDLL